MKIKKQYRSIAVHNGTASDKTYPVGYIPQLDDVAPLSAYDDNGQATLAFSVDVYHRFVDVHDGKPLTQWMPA